MTSAICKSFTGTELKLTMEKKISTACRQRFVNVRGSTFAAQKAGMIMIIAVATVAPRRLNTSETDGTAMAMAACNARQQAPKIWRGRAGSTVDDSIVDGLKVP